MSSPFTNFFEDNLIKKCINDNFGNINCILGSSEISLSLILLIFLSIGLKRMINYYDKINFEITLIIFSIFQIILIDTIIIIPHDFLFEIFFLIQLFLTSLIIRKFIHLTKNTDSKFKENLIFIIMNIINIIIFSLFLLSLLKIFLEDIYLYTRFSSRIFYFLATINLALLCRVLIKKLDKFESANELCDLNVKKTLKSQSSLTSNLKLDFHSTEWMFFIIRKKQISPLYILNLICSFIQMIFILFKNFILTEHFKKIEYKLISTDEGYIIYYIYLLTYFLNVSINFFCFYWLIRDQYQINNINPGKKRKNSKLKILDDDFIERETIVTLDLNESKNDNNFIFIEKRKNSKEYKKSLYSYTFTDDEDKDDQEKYFVKNSESNNKDTKEENEENNNNDEKDINISKNAINRISIIEDDNNNNNNNL